MTELPSADPQDLRSSHCVGTLRPALASTRNSPHKLRQHIPIDQSSFFWWMQILKCSFPTYCIANLRFEKLLLVSLGLLSEPINCSLSPLVEPMLLTAWCFPLLAALRFQCNVSKATRRMLRVCHFNFSISARLITYRRFKKCTQPRSRYAVPSGEIPIMSLIILSLHSAPWCRGAEGVPHKYACGNHLTVCYLAGTMSNQSCHHATSERSQEVSVRNSCGGSDWSESVLIPLRRGIFRWLIQSGNAPGWRRLALAERQTNRRPPGTDPVEPPTAALTRIDSEILQAETLSWWIINFAILSRRKTKLPFRTCIN